MSFLDDDERRKLTEQATQAQLRLSKLEAELEIARLRRAERRRRAICIAVRKTREKKKKALAAGHGEKGHLVSDQGHLFSQQFLRCPKCLEMLHQVERAAKRRSVSVEAFLASVVEPRVKA